MSAGAVLIVPACEKGRGGGHIARSLFLLQRLLDEGREAFLWIRGDHKKEVFRRFPVFFGMDGEDADWEDHEAGIHGRFLSEREDIVGRNWDFIVLDLFCTMPEEFTFWSSLPGSAFQGKPPAPLIGIDEGGPCRNQFDFLIDLLPSLSKHAPNLNAPCLLPLPKNRRQRKLCDTAGKKNRPISILICFGAEDPAFLGMSTAGVLSSHFSHLSSPMPKITLVNPSQTDNELSDTQQKIRGVNISGKIPKLREHLSEYDLFITHFGLGAFEAVYARVPVLLLSPTPYHEKLARNSGFTTMPKKPSSRRLELLFKEDFLEKLDSKNAKMARRFGLEEDQKEDLGSFIGRLAPRSPQNCPVCGEKIDPVPIARFPEETFRRCMLCGAICLCRLTPPPIEYERDYFFDFYEKQYGKTYLQDFPNLMEMGRRRLANIKTLLKFPLHERGDKHLDPGIPCLLDIGCAYGPFLAAAGEAGFSPSGIEPAQDAVRYVKEELKYPCWQGFFPEALTMPGRYDAITLWYVIEHFEEAGKMLREINRLLNDGGVLAFSTPSSAGISGRKSLHSFLKNSPQDHYTIWSPKVCKQVLLLYGFRLRKIVVTGHHPERFPLLGRYVKSSGKGCLFRLLLFASRIFRLGDTFEAYGVKIRSCGSQ